MERGWWWAKCCLHDLEPIRTAEDLQRARDDRDTWPYRGAWPTLADALRALLPEEDREGLELLIEWGGVDPALRGALEAHVATLSPVTQYPRR